ncbi:MAG TPA: hypothetical protein VGN12_12190 [Pirellulales bacterium]|jgi:hypothetical protein
MIRFALFSALVAIGARLGHAATIEPLIVGQPSGNSGVLNYMAVATSGGGYATPDLGNNPLMDSFASSFTFPDGSTSHADASYSISATPNSITIVVTLDVSSPGGGDDSDAIVHLGVPIVIDAQLSSYHATIDWQSSNPVQHNNIPTVGGLPTIAIADYNSSGLLGPSGPGTYSHDGFFGNTSNPGPALGVIEIYLPFFGPWSAPEFETDTVSITVSIPVPEPPAIVIAGVAGLCLATVAILNSVYRRERASLTSARNQ